MFAASIWLLLATAVVGFAARKRYRWDAGPGSYWTWGWLSLFAGGGLEVYVARPALMPLAHALGMLFGALLLAGAFSFRGRRFPDWLPAAALVFGTLRGALVGSGWPVAGHAVGLAVEPAMVALAAAIVWPAARGLGRPLHYLLAPSFIAVAILEAISAIGGMRQGGLGTPLLFLWVVGGPAAFAVAIAAAAQRERRKLQQTRDDLSRRVTQRTHELEQAVTTLQSEVRERRSAEEALRQSELRYRLVSELSSDYSFSALMGPDHTFKAEWVTDAIKRMTGYAPEELEGHDWHSMIHPDDLDRFIVQLDAVVAGDANQLDYRVVTRNGGVRRLLCRLTAMPDPDSGWVRLVGAVQDVTEQHEAEAHRRALEANLQESQRLESLGVLAGGVAHDFNNLLTVILGNARLLLDEGSQAAPKQERLLAIRAAAEQADGLTQQMLTYSGKKPPELCPVDLSLLITQMGGLLNSAASQFARLETDLAEDLPAIEGDASQLRQIVINLVTNASEALPEGRGRITVRTALVQATAADLAEGFGASDPSPGAYVSLEVEDDGEGLGEQLQLHVFEPFFTTKFAGRGLGLASVLGIVRGHGGLIRLQSQPAQGTLVRALFPVTARAVPTPPEAEPNHAAPLRGRILVVDDDEAVLELVAIFLERAGFEVETAASGIAALERFGEEGHAFDAVVLDLAMPDLGGEQVFRKLRALRPDLPVVLASGYGEELSGERFRSGGLAGFLRKPFEPEELIETLRSALSR